MHLFFYFRLLAFLLLNITDGNPFKAKLGIFIEEQGPASVESLCKGATDHESLRATSLGNVSTDSCSICKHLHNAATWACATIF